MGKGWTSDDLKAKGFDPGTGKRIEKFPKDDYADLKKANDIAFEKETPSLLEGIKIAPRPAFTVFIPYNVPSSKNSRINSTRLDANDKAIRKESGKLQTISIASKLVQEYRKKVGTYFIHYMKDFSRLAVRRPVKCEFLFVRDSNRRFDFHNAVQVVADLMVEFGWIDDDNMDEFLPYPPRQEQYYMVNKKQPGVYISLID